MKRTINGTYRGKRHLARIWILLLLFFAAIPQAYAQRGPMDGRRGPMDKDEFLAFVVPRLSEAVELTDTQSAQVRDIMAEHWEVMNARRQTMLQKSRSERRAARQTMMDGMMQQRESTHNRIEELLTDEQKEKFRAYQDQQENRPRGRIGGPRSGR